jgi:hypothetical protein
MKRKNLALIIALFVLSLFIPSYIFADSGENQDE